jgi:hypothetical protein
MRCFEFIDGECVCCVPPCCCSAADARAAEISAAAEGLDQREADLEGREAAVQAATADLEGREEVLAQQKTEMAAQQVRPVSKCACGGSDIEIGPLNKTPPAMQC